MSGATDGASRRYAVVIVWFAAFFGGGGFHSGKSSSRFSFPPKTIVIWFYDFIRRNPTRFYVHIFIPLKNRSGIFLITSITICHIGRI